MAAVDDPHDILGVSRDASVEEIRAAYRAAAKIAHPDRGGSSEAFQRVRASAERLLAKAKLGAVSPADGAYEAGDRTSAAGDWQAVSEALRLRWRLTFAPLMVFAPSKIGLSPFATATSLNAPAYRWLSRTVGARGETWDFHVAGEQTRLFFRRPDDARLFKLRFI